LRINRRDAIKTMGALAGTAAASRILSGCGDNSSGGGGEIETLVFLLMENRSYDTWLGARAFEGKPGDGLVAGMSNPDRLGASVPIWPATADLMQQCVVLDPPHEWDRSRVAWNNGANDGFVLTHQDRYDSDTAIDPMQYQTRENLPVTWALADAYTTCDRWFSAILGPTYPNRMYWHGATCNGYKTNPEVQGGDFQGIPSIYHRLDAAGVEWAYYYGNVPLLVVLDDIDLTGRLRRYLDFLDEAAAGTLPPVVYIDPAFNWNDNHPPHHPLLGEQLIAATYQALATSPHWDKCMLVVAYDEHGGFFDHVPPPAVPDDRAADGFGQCGFRVPSMVIGPYAKTGYVSSVQYDHTSALKHIENKYALEPLNQRDAAANDLGDCIDVARLAAGEATSPIVLPPVVIDEAALPNFCLGEGDIMRTHDMLRLVAQEPKLQRLYRPGVQVRDDIYDIAAYLDRHNLGRIRRSPR
jgi:phospholipase C